MVYQLFTYRGASGGMVLLLMLCTEIPTMPMRTRIRNTIVNSTLPTVATYYNNNETLHVCQALTQARSLNFQYPIGRSEIMIDCTVPGFERRKAAGEIFNNPMSRIVTERSVDQGTSVVGWHWKPSELPGHRHCGDFYREIVPLSPGGLNALGGPVDHLGVPSISMANLKDRAGTDAYSAIDAPTFDGATFVAELHETISFLKAPLHTLIGHLRSIRKSRKSASRRLVFRKGSYSFFEDNWLAYRYGIRPLVKDIENAAVAVAQTVLNEKPARKTARGSSSDDRSSSAAGSVTNSSGVTFAWDTTTTQSVKIRTGVLYEYFRDPDTFGVEFLRVPAAVWEAIPYSFVVDRLVNVGSFINAITPKAGIKHLSAWTSTEVYTTTQRHIRTASVANDSSGRVGFMEGDGLSREQFSSLTKTRTPGVSLGLTYNPHPLTWNGETDMAEITDLVTLSLQLLRGR